MTVVIGWTILAAVVLLCAAAAALASYVALPRCISLADSRAIENKAGFLRDYDALPKTEYTIASFDGYVLHAECVPAAVPSRRWVILSHGYTYSRYGSVKYMQLFRSLGYNAVLYDDRRHGLNAKTVCTMGISESRDLLAVIRDTYTRYGKDIFLGLHGESMGSGLEIMALGQRPDVRFVVNDCGYATLLPVLEGQLRQRFHLPGWLAYPASAACRLLYGYAFTRVRPVDSLAGCTVPICFLHGEEDAFIPKSHSEQMQAATAGYSELHLFPGAGHAMSYASNEARYWKIVSAFVRRVEKEAHFEEIAGKQRAQAK